MYLRRAAGRNSGRDRVGAGHAPYPVRHLRGVGGARQELGGRGMGRHPRIRALSPSGTAFRTCPRQRLEGDRRLAGIDQWSVLSDQRPVKSSYLGIRGCQAPRPLALFFFCLSGARQMERRREFRFGRAVRSCIRRCEVQAGFCVVVDGLSPSHEK